MQPEDYKPQDFRWSQRDLRWSWKRMGGSTLTVGGYGCASVAANYAVNRAWKANNIPRFARPDEFVDYCNKKGGYTSTGLINWNIVNTFSMKRPASQRKSGSIHRR